MGQVSDGLMFVNADTFSWISVPSSGSTSCSKLASSLSSLPSSAGRTTRSHEKTNAMSWSTPEPKFNDACPSRHSLTVCSGFSFWIIIIVET